MSRHSFSRLSCEALDQRLLPSVTAVGLGDTLLVAQPADGHAAQVIVSQPQPGTFDVSADGASLGHFTGIDSLSEQFAQPGTFVSNRLNLIGGNGLTFVGDYGAAVIAVVSDLGVRAGAAYSFTATTADNTMLMVFNMGSVNGTMDVNITGLGTGGLIRFYDYDFTGTGHMTLTMTDQGSSAFLATVWSSTAYDATFHGNHHTDDFEVVLAGNHQGITNDTEGATGWFSVI